METLIGICGKDFVIIAANANLSRSVVIMNHEQDRLSEINKNCVMGVSGDFGDALVLSEYIKANVSLEEDRESGKSLTMNALSSYVRKEIANSLRSQNAYQTNVIIAGCDIKEEKTIPSVYWIDYLATLKRVPYAVHGHASSFCASILDRNYKEEMDETEVISLLKSCLNEIRKRFSINQGEFIIKMVDKKGIRFVESN